MLAVDENSLHPALREWLKWEIHNAAESAAGGQNVEFVLYSACAKARVLKSIKRPEDVVKRHYYWRSAVKLFLQFSFLLFQYLSRTPLKAINGTRIRIALTTQLVRRGLVLLRTAGAKVFLWRSYRLLAASASRRLRRVAQRMSKVGVLLRNMPVRTVAALAGVYLGAYFLGREILRYTKAISIRLAEPSMGVGMSTVAKMLRRGAIRRKTRSQTRSTSDGLPACSIRVRIPSFEKVLRRGATALGMRAWRRMVARRSPCSRALLEWFVRLEIEDATNQDQTRVQVAKVIRTFQGL